MRSSRTFDWDQYWTRFGEYSASVPGTIYRERLILNLLGSLGAEDRLFDIGCGIGELSQALRQAYPDTPIRGTDYAQSAIDAATARVPDGVFFVRDLQVDTDVTIDQRAWATHAVCSEVLEHVEDPIEFLRQAGAYLRDGCRIVVTVPSGPRTAFDREIGHVRHFTPSSLKHVLFAAGYEVGVIRRAGFPFHNLYKLAIMLRGRQLARDLEASEQARQITAPIKVATSLFSFAFRANFDHSPFGWQLVANAVYRT